MFVSKETYNKHRYKKNSPTNHNTTEWEPANIMQLPEVMLEVQEPSKHGSTPLPSEPQPPTIENNNTSKNTWQTVAHTASKVTSYCTDEQYGHTDIRMPLGVSHCRPLFWTCPASQELLYGLLKKIGGLTAHTVIHFHAFTILFLKQNKIEWKHKLCYKLQVLTRQHL